MHGDEAAIIAETSICPSSRRAENGHYCRSCLREGRPEAERAVAAPGERDRPRLHRVTDYLGGTNRRDAAVDRRSRRLAADCRGRRIRHPGVAMTFQSIPSGVVIFLDANTLIY